MIPPGGGSTSGPNGKSRGSRAQTERGAGGSNGSTGSSPFPGLPDAEPVVGEPVGATTGQSTETEKAQKKRQGAAAVVGAAKGVTKKLRAGAGAVVDDFVLVVVGLLTLASALLGTVVIYRSRQHLLR